MHSQWFLTKELLRAAISSYLRLLHRRLFILAAPFIQSDVQFRQNAIQDSCKKKISKGSSRVLWIGKNS